MFVNKTGKCALLSVMGLAVVVFCLKMPRKERRMGTVFDFIHCCFGDISF